MRSQIALALVSAAIALPVTADETYSIDPAHTFPTFEVGHLGYSVMRGRFNKSQGKITLDRAAKAGSMEVAIDTTSVDTGWPKRDDHLRSDDFFAVAKYPTMNFKATQLTFDGDKLVSADGELTMIGQTKPAKLVINNF